MAGKTIRRSIAMTPEMHSRLEQLVSKQGHDITESDLIREAIRLYLDEQQDIIGSRRHFARSFQDRIDRLEYTLEFHLNVLLLLLANALPEMLPHFTKERTTPSQLLQQAIIAARRDGERLLAQMDAVRNMENDKDKS
jgi:predicted DNA-binding protein